VTLDSKRYDQICVARKNAFLAGSGQGVLESVRKLTSNLDLGSKFASSKGM
jgi:hypothetical protein